MRVESPRRRARLSLVLGLVLLGVATLGVQRTLAAPSAYDRNEIPGHYTVGLYADEMGKSTELTLDRDQREFEIFLGVTGDSTRTFSAAVLRLELPARLRLAGPIRWSSIAGLKEKENIVDAGVLIEFNQDCQVQKGMGPVMLGRIPLVADPAFEEATLTPLGHRNWGLSVELCDPDRAWPKPYAEPVSITVKRKQSLWERMTGWMR